MAAAGVKAEVAASWVGQAGRWAAVVMWVAVGARAAVAGWSVASVVEALAVGSWVATAEMVGTVETGAAKAAKADAMGTAAVSAVEAPMEARMVVWVVGEEKGGEAATWAAEEVKEALVILAEETVGMSAWTPCGFLDNL